MRLVIFGRVFSFLAEPFHRIFIEAVQLRDVYPLNWPDATIKHYIATVHLDIESRKPYLRGAWLKAERVTVLQTKIAADLGWTFERGFGRRQVEQLVELGFSNQGFGLPNETIKRGQHRNPEAQDILRDLSDKQLQDTWNSLCDMSPVCLALEEGPYDDTPSMADWMKQVFWEICYRRASGVELVVWLSGGHS